MNFQFFFCLCQMYFFLTSYSVVAFNIVLWQIFNEKSEKNVCDTLFLIWIKKSFIMAARAWSLRRNEMLQIKKMVGYKFCVKFHSFSLKSVTVLQSTYSKININNRVNHCENVCHSFCLYFFMEKGTVIQMIKICIWKRSHTHKIKNELFLLNKMKKNR